MSRNTIVLMAAVFGIASAGVSRACATQPLPASRGT